MIICIQFSFSTTKSQILGQMQHLKLPWSRWWWKSLIRMHRGCWNPSALSLPQPPDGSRDRGWTDWTRLGIDLQILRILSGFLESRGIPSTHDGFSRFLARKFPKVYLHGMPRLGWVGTRSNQPTGGVTNQPVGWPTSHKICPDWCMAWFFGIWILVVLKCCFDTWNSKEPLFNGCLVISNHFLCKDLESFNWNNHSEIHISCSRKILSTLPTLMQDLSGFCLG